MNKLRGFILGLILLLPSLAVAQNRTVIATDDFNRAAPLGANWTQVNAVDTTATICSSTLLCGSHTALIGVARWVGAGTFTDAQYSSLAMVATTWGSPNYGVGVAVRVSPDTNSGRDYYYHNARSDNVSVFGKVVNGVNTTFVSSAVSWNPGDRVEIEVNGSTVTAMKNGVALGGAFTVTDTSITTGVPGVTAFGDSGRASGDNWTAGNLSTDTQPPTVPGSVQTAVISSTQINLAWTASTDDNAVVNYRVERCTGAACVNFSEVGAPTAASFPNTGLTTATVYRYRVRAFDGINFSAYSTIVQATTLTARQATVTWADTVNTDQTGFTVQRKTGAGGTFADIGSVGPSLRLYVDPDSPTPIACYRVRAIRSGEDGPQSGEACTVTTSTPTPPINLIIGGKIAFGGANTTRIESRDTTAPSMPTNLVANVISSTQINLTWTASTDNIAVSNYRVERCEISGCIDFVQIATPTGTSLSDTGLTSSTFYQYRVRAWDGTNYSAYSSIATGTTDADQVLVNAIWVRTGGTMSGCTKSIGAPATNAGFKGTIDGGIACLASGDTLIIQNGTYAEIIDTATVRAIPAGSTGANTTIRAQNRGQVILTGRTPGALEEATVFLRDGSRFITIDGIILDGSNGATKSGFAGGGASDPPRDIELSYVQARNFQQQGIIFAHGTTGGRLRVSHSRSNNNGTNCLGFALGSGHCHGLYINGFPNSTIEDSEFDNNEAFGIHAYSEPAENDNVVIQRNRIHHNGIGGAQGVSGSTAGIIAGSGIGIRVENNLVYNNKSGVWADFNAVNVKFSNNSIYQNTGALDPYSCIYDGANGVSGTIAINNICYLNDRGIVNASGSLTQNNNVTANPLFVNPGSGDFRLSAGSTAIGTGANLSAQFTTDYNGTTRTVPYDVGALAFSSAIAPTCPATVGNGLVAAYSFNGVDTDSSINANPAFIGAGNAFVTGKYGQGVGFDGTTAVLLNHIAAYWLCNGYTLSAWVSVPAITDFRAVISSDYAGQDGYFLYAGNDFYGQAGAPIGGYCTSVLACSIAINMTNLTAATLTYLSVTYDPTGASANTKYWVNGAVVATANGQAQLSNWTGLIAIGGSPYGEILPSGSIIDEVRIYNKPLTGAQIIADRDTPL